MIKNTFIHRYFRGVLKHGYSCTILIALLFIMLFPAKQLRAQDDLGNEYRVTLFPSHKVYGKLSGFAYLGFVWNNEKGYKTYYLGWPAGLYAPNKWLQVWAGLVGLFTDNKSSSDKLEFRPFGGAKLFLPNGMKWNIYNFSRYEYRAIQDRDSRDWSDIHRVRSRFGVEIPLTSLKHAWEVKSLYMLADLEPYYRFDKGQVDPFRMRAGLGYVLNERIRLEFIYHAQYTHPSGSSKLKYTDNIFRLNIKIGLNKGIITLLQNPEIDD
jgi:hypothetical protein